MRFVENRAPGQEKTVEFEPRKAALINEVCKLENAPQDSLVRNFVEVNTALQKVNRELVTVMDRTEVMEPAEVLAIKEKVLGLEKEVELQRAAMLMTEQKPSTTNHSPMSNHSHGNKPKPQHSTTGPSDARLAMDISRLREDLEHLRGGVAKCQDSLTERIQSDIEGVHRRLEALVVSVNAAQAARTKEDLERGGGGASGFFAGGGVCAGTERKPSGGGFNLGAIKIQIPPRSGRSNGGTPRGY